MSSTEDGLEEGGFDNHHHVPQQSRRDKLRVINLLQTQHYYPASTTYTNTTSYQQAANHHHVHLLPVATLYDPSDDDDLLRCSVAGNPLLLAQAQRGGRRIRPKGTTGDDDDDYANSNYELQQDQHPQQQQQALPLVRVSSTSAAAGLGKGVNFMAGFGGGGSGSGGGGGLMNQMMNNPSCSSVHQDINNNNNQHFDVNHNLRDYFDHLHHHHQQQQQQQSTTTLFIKPQTLSLTNTNYENSSPTSIVQAADGGGGGGGGGGGLSLSLSSSHPPPPTHNYNNNNNHQAAALELNNLMMSPQQLRCHDHQSSSSSIMLDGPSGTGGGYTIGGGGGGGGGGGTGSSASALTSNGGISTTSGECSRVPPVPNHDGPFTGYTLIMKKSRFLKPAQQLLKECCNVSGGGASSTSIGTGGISHHHVDDHRAMIRGGEGDSLISNLMDPQDSHDTRRHQVLEKLNESGTSRDGRTSTSTSDHHHHQTNKKTTRLISMLDEVYKRYKQYYQQMLAIVASFESVADLGNAAPYTSFAIKAMSKHFRGLKNAITDQLYFTSINSGELSPKKDEYPRFGTNDQYVRSQRAAQDTGNILERQNAWRTQRGLPERAVAVLKAWLFEHFLHPYPTDTDKQMLAKQTGLSRSQVSNWFINARVRLWKPMVEEIHMLETRQKASEAEDRNTIQIDEPLTAKNSCASDKQPQTNKPTLKAHDPPLKRSRNELPPLVPANSTNDQMLNFSCNNLSSYQHVSVGGHSTGANNRVSLTLGLHQNNGTGLSGAPSFPMSIAQRFGIEADNQGYVIDSGFEASNNRPYRKDMGGQLLHDFIG